MVTAAIDPVALAQACAGQMWSNDRASQSLGMVVEEVGPGQARLSMTVRSDMVNGHDVCHGELITTLADSAFAFACNSRGTATVASGFDINFLEPAHLDDALIGEGREIALRGRSGIYDITVLRGDTVIAEFRGRSRSLGRPILKENR